jgi:O-antigen/teichoic acid export membrane protein
MVGAGYLIGNVTTGVLLRVSGADIGWLDIWLIIGSWSLIGSVITFLLSHHLTTGTEIYRLAEVLRVGRRFALWGTIASIFFWLRSDGLFLILARVAGLDSVAETRAVFNLGAPLLQVNMALQTTAIVAFSNNHTNGSKRNIWNILVMYLLGITILLPLAYHYSGWLIGLVYGGRYVDGAWQLPLYCLSLCLGTLDAIISSVFKAQRKMRDGYSSMLIGGVASIILGSILIPIQHTLISAMVLSAAIGFGVSLVLRMRARI